MMKLELSCIQAKDGFAKKPKPSLRVAANAAFELRLIRAALYRRKIHKKSTRARCAKRLPSEGHNVRIHP